MSRNVRSENVRLIRFGLMATCVINSDVNKARKLKAKAKAIPVGNEAGTVPSRTAMGDHGK